MTNGELFFKTFPCLEQDEKWPNLLWWTDEKGKRQLLGDVYDSNFWDAEYKEPTKKMIKRFLAGMLFISGWAIGYLLGMIGIDVREGDK